MAATIPLKEPAAFEKGDTVKWRRSFTDYDPASWTLYYEFAHKSDHQEVTGSDNGDGTHLISISMANSNKFKPGPYRYVGYVDDGSERYTLTRGTILVLAEFDQRTTGYDGRSFAAKALEAIENVLLGRASEDELSMSVSGRSVTLMSTGELLDARERLLSEVRQEQADEAQARGEGTGQKVLTRFVRPDWQGPSGRWRWPFNS